MCVHARAAQRGITWRTERRFVLSSLDLSNMTLSFQEPWLKEQSSTFISNSAEVLWTSGLNLNISIKINLKMCLDTFIIIMVWVRGYFNDFHNLCSAIKLPPHIHYTIQFTSFIQDRTGKEMFITPRAARRFVIIMGSGEKGSSRGTVICAKLTVVWSRVYILLPMRDYSSSFNSLTVQSNKHDLSLPSLLSVPAAADLSCVAVGLYYLFPHPAELHKHWLA